MGDSRPVRARRGEYGGTGAIASGNDLIAKLQSVTTPEEFSDLENTSDLMQSMGECRMQIERLGNVPQMIKSADKMIQRLKKKGVDVADIASQFAALQSQWNTIRAGNYSSEDLDTFFSAAEDLGSAMMPLMEEQGIQIGNMFGNQGPQGGMMNQGGGGNEKMPPQMQMKTPPRPTTGDQGGSIYNAFLNFFRFGK